MYGLAARVEAPMGKLKQVNNIKIVIRRLRVTAMLAL